MANEILTRGCLYRLTFPNGKIYIGITKRLVSERFYEHCKSAKNGSQHAVHRAIRKHGAAFIAVDVLAKAEWNYLTALESRAIVAFDAKGDNGYNLTNGGEGVPGIIVSAATKAKLSAAHTGRKREPHSIETRSKISQANTGKKRTFEQNSAMSAARKGKSISPENLEKLRLANVGRRRTDTEKAALSAARLGKPLSAEHRAKLSAAKKGKPLSDKSIASLAKLIASCTGRVISAETSAKRWATRRASKPHKEVTP